MHGVIWHRWLSLSSRITTGPNYKPSSSLSSASNPKIFLISAKEVCLSLLAPPAREALTKAVLCRSIYEYCDQREKSEWERTDFHNPLFNCSLDDIPSHVDWFILTQTMDSVNSLLFNSFIPPCIHHEYVYLSANIQKRAGLGLTICHCQIETYTSCFQGD